MMRADIATGLQGIRNAADAISLIQTADGAMAVIDEKLTRMKELAEQAATGTYTSVQRQIINSEYQAMAAEIDRIANSTNFNGVKLLDGSMNALNNGQGIRIHFGVGNSAAEDYYYVQTDNVRATDTNGLKIGGDATNDIWAIGPYEDNPGSCCVGTIPDLTARVKPYGGYGTFGFGYNEISATATDEQLYNSRNLAGRYGQDQTITYQQLIDEVNQGTQSRVVVQVDAPLYNFASGGYFALCIDDEIYVRRCANATVPTEIWTGKRIQVDTAAGIVSAGTVANWINSNPNSNYWAYTSSNGYNLVIFRKDGGDNNDIRIEEMSNDPSEAWRFSYINPETRVLHNSVMNFALGGEHWGTLEANYTGKGYSIALLGRDVGDQRDLSILGRTRVADTTFENRLVSNGIALANQYIQPLKGNLFTEIQDASDGAYDGAEIRTQGSAQRALLAINNAIERKDVIRANLGATQNRLEATITNLTIQVENLQASESRISDVDVATEMTNFTRNNILAQAATAMLAQANSLGNLALSLIMG
jgi:flagellin